jgi:hypothetical protein
MGCAEHAARMREIGDVYKIFVGKSEGRRRLGRPRHIDELKWISEKYGRRGKNWIHLAV